MLDSTIVGDNANNTLVVDQTWIDDYQGLLNQDAQYELVLLDWAQYGIEQISEALSRQEAGAIDSTEIISNDQFPFLEITSRDEEEFDTANLLDSLTGLQEVLSNNVDILLYGSGITAPSDVTGVGGDLASEDVADSLESPLVAKFSQSYTLGDDARRPLAGFWGRQLWMANSSHYDLDPRQFTASNMVWIDDGEKLSSGDLGTILEHGVNYYFFEEGHVYDLPMDSFNELQYLASHPDLIATYGTNLEKVTEHYILFGYHENRAEDSFNEAQYLASNPDLIPVFGTNLRAATEHYVANGYTEGRATTSFDPLRYLAANPDLVAVFGNDTERATMHYITDGFYEGRATG